MRDLVLFDMDGTLTPARKMISPLMINSLRKLRGLADIGILTGSGFGYVQEQCSKLWDGICDDNSSLQILPCNGTQQYRWKDTSWQLISSVDMIDEMGESYSALIRYLMSVQYQLLSTTLSNLSVTGTFFQYRGSMLNWCLIGRDSNDEARAAFYELDKNKQIRQKIKDDVEAYLELVGYDNVSLGLGGHTSIDIYPKGWDKTYALSYFPNRKIWFIGDSCTGSGNDRSIYEAIRKHERGYITSGPDETLRIIEEIMDRIND